ncbi:hemolysin III family protein [Bifidobacterium actinocoloniiforme DSM 22766]|uniref:Hemolysin III family protein n=1 Tax=Bifidobacterium actinocoloniiforme DSM 22766 TaxID=1437605 RepID=A0A086Z020_9BIFI|nr:hemolysin III family protein [Bifidobacterium actinocoloniiforme DSM 22766]
MANHPQEQGGQRVAAQREQRRLGLPDARQQAHLARGDRMKANADAARDKARDRASRIIQAGDLKAAKIEGIPARGIARKVRLDVHGRPKPLMRGWIHAAASPLALASGIVLICIAPGVGIKWACVVFMLCSLALFGNSALYHLGDWSPRVTDILRRLDHANIFLLIAGTYTPVAFALDGFWRRVILVGIWSATIVVMFIHVVWISAPRWLYTTVYVIFGVAGVAFLGLFWKSPSAGPAVVWLLIAGGLCYIAGAVVYALCKPDPSAQSLRLP